MEVWWVGTDGSVQGGYWYEGQSWQRYQLAPPGSGLDPKQRAEALATAFLSSERAPIARSAACINCGPIAHAVNARASATVTTIPICDLSVRNNSAEVFANVAGSPCAGRRAALLSQRRPCDEALLGPDIFAGSVRPRRPRRSWEDSQALGSRAPASSIHAASASSASR